jgi:Domain of unknown function (DU1801)
MTPIKDAAVAQVFEHYPPVARRKLLALRELIFATAAKTNGVGKLEETLKWGEPAYLTSETKSGSTIRIAWKKTKPHQYAMYFNCNTNLIERFRTRFRHTFNFEGNRAIVFEVSELPDTEALTLCIAEALTYHQR